MLKKKARRLVQNNQENPVLSGLHYVTGVGFWTLLGKHKRLWAYQTSAGTTQPSNPGEQ